jgi:hypothetical protein
MRVTNRETWLQNVHDSLIHSAPETLGPGYTNVSVLTVGGACNAKCQQSNRDSGE